MNLLDLASLLDEIAEGRCDLREIESDFRKRLAGADDLPTRAVVWALNYRLIDSSDTDGRQTYGPFAPLMEIGGTVFPPYVADLPPDVLAMWEQLAGQVHSPAVLGRLRDLLWVSRQGNSPFAHARQAIANYLSATRVSACDGLEVGDLLDRALELSRELNAPELATALRPRAREALDVELGRNDAASRPGVWLPLLRLLVDQPEADRPGDLGSLMARAHALLEASHPFLREAIFQLDEVLARGRVDEITRIRRAKVEMWLEWALQQDGLLRIVELGKALELANNTPEASDLRDVIRRHIQRIDPATQGLRTVSAEMDIPTEQVDALIARIVGNDGLEQALNRLGSWGPPTGDPEATARAVDDQIKQFPMQFLVSQVVSHNAGYPILYLETDEDKRAAALVRHEMLGCSIHAVLAEDALDRIGAEYSSDQAELQTLFTTDLIPQDQAEPFARAFEHYWASRPDESIHVALPRIEAVLRRMLAEAGGVVYKEPRGRRPGGVKTLGEVLHDLRPIFHEGWWRFLSLVLAEPLGLNLRNEYLHGLVASATKRDAVLVLVAAAHLRLLRLESRRSPAS